MTNKIARVEKEINKKEENLQKGQDDKSSGTINYRRKLYGNYVLLCFAAMFFSSFSCPPSILFQALAFIFQFVEQNCNYFLMFKKIPR